MASSPTAARVSPATSTSPASPDGPAPQSFLWFRRIFLTLLTGFVMIPVYVMISSSLKPLAGRHRHVPAGCRRR
ncbi:hypothetical protein SHIRM173S_04446 [Streptomyces hirsutus]